MELVREKVGLCVELRDIFTNKCVEDKNIIITVNGHRPIAKKEGKYYVFKVEPSSNIEVYITSEDYAPKCVTLDIGRVEQNEVFDLLPDGWLVHSFQIPVLTILLESAQSHPLMSGQVRQEFFGVPYEWIPVVKNPKHFFLLEEDYQGGDRIIFSMPEQENSMCLQIEDEQGKENFVVIGQDGQCNCRLLTPLQRSYSKGSRIHEIYYVKADAEGKAVGIQFR